MDKLKALNYIFDNGIFWTNNLRDFLNIPYLGTFKENKEYQSLTSLIIKLRMNEIIQCCGKKYVHNQYMVVNFIKLKEEIDTYLK